MANPVVTTQTATDIYNTRFQANGLSSNPGWEVLSWGFWYYKKSDGIETKAYLAASSPVVEGGGNFYKSIAGLIPYTEYVFQATAYYLDDEETENYEAFGDWVEVTTGAEADVQTTVAINVTKYPTGVNTATLIGYIRDDAGSNILTRGFKYGLSEADTYDVHTSGGNEGKYTLGLTDIAGNTDFYFRAYVTTPTGTYYADQYVKFSTKDIEPRVYMVVHEWWGRIPEFYILSFGNNGETINAFYIGDDYYWGQNNICANSDNIYVLRNNNTIVKLDLSGNVVTTQSVSGVGAYSIAIKDDYIIVRGRHSDFHYLQKRNLDTLAIVGSGEILKWSSSATAYKGLAIDSDGYIYTINLADNLLEKWKWEDTLEDDNITEEDVHIDTDIIDVDIDIPTGTIIEFYTWDTLPSPLEESTEYWAIRVSSTQIRVATSKQNALDGIYIDLLDTGTDRHSVYAYGWGKEAEIDLSKVYAGSNHIAVANILYSVEYGEQGWTTQLSLGTLTEWTPDGMSCIKSAGSFGSFLLIAGIDTEGNYVISKYNSSKILIWKTELSLGFDNYSIAGVESIANLENIKAERRRELARVRLYGEIL